jgi:hypothetical protein
MASTYVNDLRLNEMATGDGSGTWGTTTNTNLELIAEAFSYGTEVITTNADTHTTTIADGATDPGRSLYLKYTGTLDSACTITIGPNTVSKVWIIENGTSGSQNIIISQGSGANITIPAGDTKVVYSDGAGAGAAFVDAFASLSVVDLKVQDDLTVTDDASIGGDATITGTLGVTGNITGTLATAAQPNITSVGTLTGFTSTGIDDNADATAITIDSSENVGIGTSSPASVLEISNNSTVTNAVGPVFTLTNESLAVTAADVVLGKLNFSSSDPSGSGGTGIGGSIGVFSERPFDGGPANTYMALSTRTSATNTERMRIDSVGTTTIKTDGTTQLVLNRADASIQSGNQVAQLLVTGDDPSAGQSGAAISFIAGDAWATNSYPTNITFSNDLSGTLTERLRIDSTGVATFSGNLITEGLLVVAAGQQLYLDGGSDTYIDEVAANTMRFATGGTERMRINSDGALVLQEGNPIYADTGRVVNFEVPASYGNALNFATLGGLEASDGFYLVTAVRNGASVSSHWVGLIGVSTSGASYIYNVIQATNILAQMSGSWLQLQSASTIYVHITAVPIGITGNDT